MLLVPVCPESGFPGRGGVQDHRPGRRGSCHLSRGHVVTWTGGKGIRMRALARRLYRRSRADRWSSLFGQVAVYSFVVTGVPGGFLLFYYKPSMTQVSYQGSYRKLDGVPMSQAYQSTLDISFDVRGGLLMRPMHHWAALLFIAAVCAHLLRLYFTGAFRRPLWLNWLIWVTLLVLGMVAGLSGTILPDDMLSGGSLRVLGGVTLSIPIIGTHLMVWIF